MILHPLVLGLLLIDGFALVLLAVYLKQTLQTALGGGPDSTDKEHLDPPRQTETLSFVGRTAFAAIAVSTLLFTMMVTEALPGLVSGAMCGKGVIAATGESGTRAIFFRLIALLALAVWSTVDRISRGTSSHNHAPAVAKGLLFAVPLIGLGVFESLRMLWNLDLDTPVSCCSAVAASASMGFSTEWLTGAIANHWPWIYFIGLGAVAFWAVHNIVTDTAPLPPKYVWIYGIVAALWTTLAAVIVTHHLSAYYFGKLDHNCLWCLFREKNHYAGYAIYSSLFVVAAGALSQAATAHLSSTRLRRHGVLTLAALGIFTAATLLPAIIWRMEHGVWID